MFGKMGGEKVNYYKCPNCGYEITFDLAYAVDGEYCPNCDYPVRIPVEWWEYGDLHRS